MNSSYKNPHEIVDKKFLDSSDQARAWDLEIQAAGVKLNPRIV